jgi:4-amino-4-deoxy-L-arabinose transferase-like glycosyltransferase
VRRRTPHILLRLAHRQRTAVTGSRWPLAVALLAVGLALFHLWWIQRFRDGYPLDIDESRYMAFGLALGDELGANGPGGFLDTWRAQRDFAPLLPLTSLPFYVVFGDSVVTGLASQLVFFGLLVAASYGLGTRLTTPAGGALVALLVASTPAVLDFARTYHFPVTSAAVLTAATYALLASEGLSRRRWALAWGALLGLTALSRTMMLAFIPAQLLAATWLGWARGGDRRAAFANLGLAAAAGLLVAAVWLASSWRSVLDYLTDFGYGSTSGQFGTTASRLSLAYWTHELEEAVRNDLYLPLSLLIALALGAGATAALLRLHRAQEGWREAVLRAARSDAAVVLFVVLEGYLALSSSRNQGVGFRVPFLPGVAALAVLAVWRLPWTVLRRALASALVAVAVLNIAMKANVVEPLSERELADLPVLGDTPLLNGSGYIQNLAASVLEAPSPDPTEPLPESHKLWLSAYERIAAHAVAAEGRLGRQPVVRLATYEPLLNPNNVVLAGRLRFDRGLLVAPLATPAGEPSISSYRHAVMQAPATDMLVTVTRLGLTYTVLTGGRNLDQALVRRAAGSIGLRAQDRVRLPNDRSAIVASAGSARR